MPALQFCSSYIPPWDNLLCRQRRASLFRPPLPYHGRAVYVIENFYQFIHQFNVLRSKTTFSLIFSLLSLIRKRQFERREKVEENKKIFWLILRMTSNSRNLLLRIFVLVYIVSLFIPIYRNCGNAKLQTMARTRNFYSMFFFRTSVCEIATTTNHFAPSINFRHGTRTKNLEVFRIQNEKHLPFLIRVCDFLLHRQ